MKKLTYIKYLVVVFLFISSLPLAYAVQAKPKLLFSITDLSNPESVVLYNDHLYISNIGAKNPAKKDGDGFIKKVALDNKSSEKWLTGLNDPKGLRVFNDKLYVADLDSLVVIDLTKGKILRKIPVKGSEFLNDIELDDKGNIYVADTKQSSIYFVDGKNFRSSVLIKNFEEAPNGLYFKNGRLYVSSWAHNMKPGSLFYVLLSDKSTVMLEPKEIGALDGLEEYSDYNWLVTSKNEGKLFLVDVKAGKKKLLLDNVTDAADIGFDKSKKLLMVPLMKVNEVRVYNIN